MDGLELWHKAVEDRDPRVLDSLLAENVTFHSPVVWSPQEGKHITILYLTAAMHVLGNEHFSYQREIVSDQNACLEFSTKIDDITVNGVDIITFNSENKIVDFKVMVRPYKAMEKLKEKMLEMMKG